MKYIAWLFKAAIFFTVFAFALNNQAPVRLHLWFGVHWDAPLVLVLLGTVTFGVLLGVLVMVPVWLRAKRRSGAATPPPAPTGDAPSTVPPHGI